MANKFRFEHARYALEMKPPAFRRWIALGLIGNMAKTGGRPLEFTCHDLAVLALVKPMADFNMPVSIAYKNAVRLVREAGPYDDAPAEHFWSVWPDDTQLQASRVVLKGGKVGWVVAKFEKTDAYVCGAHLTLHPRELIRRTIERAIEAAEPRVAKKRTA